MEQLAAMTTNKDQPGEKVIGRGTSLNIANRFERLHVEPGFLDDAGFDEDSGSANKVKTEYYEDVSQSVVSENSSPDLMFRYSVNPYRGCAHGCSYCYARPYHEYLGWSAGIDFETRILVKRDAPRLFREWLARPSWQCEPVQISGVTDPYQPAERKFAITRGLLQVANECSQPVHLITKNAMVTRDIDLLGELADRRLVRVVLSVTTLDQSLARIMEPRTSSPEARLRAIRELSDRGIEVAVNVAPIISGLNDDEVPAILATVAEAGAIAASYTVLRLNGAVEPVFVDWLQRHFPDRVTKVLERVRAMHDGKLADSRWKKRMRGTGVLSDTVRSVFRTFAGKYNLDRKLEPLQTGLFTRPQSEPGKSASSKTDPRQMRLFD
jgi:DNA repair photolyase